jgi:hypothetical protein
MTFSMLNRNVKILIDMFNSNHRPNLQLVLNEMIDITFKKKYWDIRLSGGSVKILM